MITSLEAETKNNTQQMFTLQESFNIQSEDAKKANAERQMSEAKVKEDLQETCTSNERAITELRNELGNSISQKLAANESRHTEIVQKFNEFNVITNTLQTQIKDQEQNMLQQNTTGLNQLREKLENIEGKTNVSNQEIEKAKKQTENLARRLDAQLAIFEDVMDKKINIDIMPKIGHMGNVVGEFEKKIIEQSANDLNPIKDQLRDIENQTGLSEQKIQELDTGCQTLQEKVLGMENQVSDSLEDLAKSDASILAKINSLESNNEHNIHQITTNLEKMIIDNSTRLHESCKSSIQSLSEHLEDQIRVNNSTTERKLAEIDTGSQQLLEKLLDLEKEVEGKLSDNTSSLENRLNNLEGDNKNNSLNIVNIQESINIQAEEAKKMDTERQINADKAKKDLEAAVADNERAITELRNELDNSIVEKFKPTEEKLNGIDGQVQILNKSVAVFESRHAETVEKFKEVNVITNTIQTQMKEQEQKMVEQSANDLIKIREQLVNLENITTVSNQEIESLKKKSQDLSGYLDQQLATFEDAMDKQINT